MSKEFYEKYPDFDLLFYKKFNKEFITFSDININKIYSLKKFYEKYPTFNLLLYKKKNNISNVSLIDILIDYHNKNNITNNNIVDVNVESIDYDDFNYNLFVNHIKYAKKFTKNQIISFYEKNIDKIKYIYSEKLFYKKYPNFNAEEYKSFNKKNIINL